MQTPIIKILLHHQQQKQETIQNNSEMKINKNKKQAEIIQKWR